MQKSLQETAIKCAIYSNGMIKTVSKRWQGTRKKCLKIRQEFMQINKEEITQWICTLSIKQQ